jgi:acetolactate synthase I/II/III large subunit
LKAYEGLAKAFAAEGTTAVFGIMGDGNMFWMSALDKLGVELVEVRHEGAGLGMADGWARATHTPGVCTATCGPGVTQLATALVTAARASSPIVAFVGEAPTTDDEYVQRYDQTAFAAACEAGYVRLLSAESTYETVRKAFYQAKTESRPVLLGAAMDIQQNSVEDEEYAPSSAMLAGQRVQPSPHALEQAADIIGGSQRPVIVAGRGAMWAGAGEAVSALAGRIGALVATSLQAKNWLMDDAFYAGISGFYGTRAAMQLFQEADCVIAIGASMNRYTTEHGYLYPNARFIQVDVKPHALMGDGRAADCYVHSDARLGAEALEQVLTGRSFQMAGFRTKEVQAQLANQFEDKARFEVEPGLLDPREVCLALDELLPADVNLVLGSGASAGFSTMLFNRPRALALAGHWFGCIGQMLPAAMGAVLATGRRRTLLVDGDASIMMHLAEIETAVRTRMPLLITCLNDQALGSEFHKFQAHKMAADLATITTPDLGAVAVSFGGKGRLARTIDDVRAAATEWLASPGVMVIDARISRQVVTLPYRRIHYGKDE